MKRLIEKLLKKEIRHIGIDIGSYGIKLVEMSHGYEKGTHDIITYGIKSLVPDTIADGEIKRQDLLVKALKELCDELGIGKGATVTLAVSGRQVISRNIKLPVMPLDELEQAVLFEAEKYIPTPIDQLYLDYTVLGESIFENSPHYCILLAAAPRELIESLCSIIQEVNLKPYAIEIEHLPLYRMWRSSYYDEAFANQALINIGHSNSHLVVFQGEEIQFTRVIPGGGSQITEALTQSFGQEAAAATELKHTRGLYLVESDEHNRNTAEDKQDYATMDTINEAVSLLYQEIQRSIDFYQMQAKVRVERLVITGGTANLQGVDVYLEKELGMPVLLGVYGELDPIYSLACGLSMREFFSI